MDGGNSCVIETQSLSKSYREEEVLHSLDLSVRQNSIFGFLGPNGAGKTTAIRLLVGLARPSAGSVKIFGLDSVAESLAIRRKIGYLAQDPHFYDYMTARETLRFTARFYFQGPAKEIEDRVQETLELVGLASKADRPIKGFSGGERQRLGIAQAQVHYPDLLILDEPAASLDPQGRRDVLEIMERLRRYTTIFYSTHILDDVQRVSDSVAILNQGRLVAQAPIADLLGGSSGLAYQICIRGDGAAAGKRLQAQNWVESVSLKNQNGSSLLSLIVTDRILAEKRILPILLQEDGIEIREFGRKRYDLEEVFLEIVEGAEDG